MTLFDAEPEPVDQVATDPARVYVDDRGVAVTWDTVRQRCARALTADYTRGIWPTGQACVELPAIAVDRVIDELERHGIAVRRAEDSAR